MRPDDKMGIADMNVDFCNKNSTKPSWKETMRENVMRVCVYISQKKKIVNVSNLFLFFSIDTIVTRGCYFISSMCEHRYDFSAY